MHVSLSLNNYSAAAGSAGEPSALEDKAIQLAQVLFSGFSAGFRGLVAPLDRKATLLAGAQDCLSDVQAALESIDEDRLQTVRAQLDKLTCAQTDISLSVAVTQVSPNQSLMPFFCHLFKRTSLTSRQTVLVNDLYEAHASRLVDRLRQDLEDDVAHEDPRFLERALIVIRASASNGIILLLEALNQNSDERIEDIADCLVKVHGIEAFVRHIQELVSDDYDAQEVVLLMSLVKKRHLPSYEQLVHFLIKNDCEAALLDILPELDGTLGFGVFLTLCASDAFKQVVQILYDYPHVLTNILKGLDHRYSTLRTQIAESLLGTARQVLEPMKAKLGQAFYPNNQTGEALTQVLQIVESFPADKVTDYTFLASWLESSVMKVMDRAADQSPPQAVLSSFEMESALDAMKCILRTPTIIPHVLSQCASGDSVLFKGSGLTLSRYVDLLSQCSAYRDILKDLTNPGAKENGSLAFASSYLLEGQAELFRDLTGVGMKDNVSLDLFLGLVNCCTAPLRSKPLEDLARLVTDAKHWPAWIEACLYNRISRDLLSLGVKGIENRAKTLAPHASTLIPVGWVDNKEGHAMFLLLTRLDEEARFREDIVDSSQLAQSQTQPVPFSHDEHRNISFSVSGISLGNVLKHLRDLLPLSANLTGIARSRGKASSFRSISPLSLEEDNEVFALDRHYKLLAGLVKKGSATRVRSDTVKAQRGDASCSIEGLKQVSRLVLGYSSYKLFHLASKLAVYLKYAPLMQARSEELRRVARQEIGKSILKHVLKKVIAEANPITAAEIMGQMMHATGWLSGSLISAMVKRLANDGSEDTLMAFIRYIKEKDPIFAIDAARMAAGLGRRKVARAIGETFLADVIRDVMQNRKLAASLVARLKKDPNYLNIENVWHDLGKAKSSLTAAWIEFCVKHDLHAAAILLKTASESTTAMDTTS